MKTGVNIKKKYLSSFCLQEWWEITLKKWGCSKNNWLDCFVRELFSIAFINNYSIWNYLLLICCSGLQFVWNRSSSISFPNLFPGSSSVETDQPILKFMFKRPKIGEVNLKKNKVGEGTKRRRWWPTPVLLPGESHGQGSLAGHSPWGHKESDTTEVT